jgi:hypothetical protein
MAALQCVLESTPDYFLSVTGAPPGGAEAQSTFTELPPDRSYEDKFVWELYEGDAMIGCADVIRGYPGREKAVASNPGALAFWLRLGYRETGEIKPRSPGFVREVVVLEKPITRAARG